MAYDKSNERLVEKQDIIHIAILLAIALVIGVYLIVTTVLIAKDGVFYIERAQQLAVSPVRIIKTHPPGYPFLILISHKLVMLFTDSTSNHIWIYSAQSITLVCRLLALIPLYFIGKLLVGGKSSFWALLILIFLPYPTRIVCDVVREWPYILFLATGFFFLLWGAKYVKWWAFGLAGLSAGLGYLIRPESAQLLAYGLLWVAMSICMPKLLGMSRGKAIVSLMLLLICFAIPTVPYMMCVGEVIPPELNHVIKSFSFSALPHETIVAEINTAGLNCNTAKIIPSNVLKALGDIFKAVGENLMWFFMPALIAGIYYRFRSSIKLEERFLITAFISVNIIMMVLRYCYIQLHVSQRWALPLITLTVFYIPVGLHVIGNLLEGESAMNRKKSDLSKRERFSWFSVLLIIGICICIPKLLRPVRIEKQGYRETARWLKGNTDGADIIAVPDKRMSFYAERKGVLFAGDRIPGSCKYAIGQFKSQGEMFLYGVRMKDELSLVKSWRDETKTIAIYRIDRSRNLPAFF